MQSAHPWVVRIIDREDDHQALVALNFTETTQFGGAESDITLQLSFLLRVGFENASTV
jgi:hypothetical protein